MEKSYICRGKTQKNTTSHIVYSFVLPDQQV